MSNLITVIPGLNLALPELIMAIGAMVLLMVDVFSGKNASGLVSGLAIALMVAAEIGRAHV